MKRAGAVAVCMFILAGCASQQETAAVNADMYAYCVKTNLSSGKDVIKYCGSSAATYKPSFRASYDYFYDLNRRKQQQAFGSITQAPSQKDKEVAAYLLGSFLKGVAEGYAGRANRSVYVPPPIIDSHIQTSASPSPGYSPLPQLAPNGTYVSGSGIPTLCPDGTYVAGSCNLAPDGKYVGN